MQIDEVTEGPADCDSTPLENDRWFKIETKDMAADDQERDMVQYVFGFVLVRAGEMRFFSPYTEDGWGEEPMPPDLQEKMVRFLKAELRTVEQE